MEGRGRDKAAPPSRPTHAMRSIFSFIFFALVHVAMAQVSEPAEQPVRPLPVEVLSGNHRLYFQLLVNKPFTPASRFGFFNVTTYTGDYTNDPTENEFVSLSNVSYTFVKHLSATLGATMNFRMGLRPFTGLQLVHTDRRWLVLITSNLYLSGDRNLEALGILEFKPRLTVSTDLYTRLQVFHNQNLSKEAHDRSYLYLRTGITRGAYSFGAGANLDRYGADFRLKENYGAFLIARLY